MTRKALRPCSAAPDCPELVRGGGPCPDHRAALDRERGTPTARGYDQRWNRTRLLYLRDHAPRNAAGEPICENCGRTAAETGHPLEVDHIDGLGPLGPRGHDPANLQTLCRSCHQTKTALQTGTGGRHD